MGQFMSPKVFCLTVVLFLVVHMMFVDAVPLTEAPEVMTSKSSLTESSEQNISGMKPEENKQMRNIPRYTKSEPEHVIGWPTDQSSIRSNTNGSSDKQDRFPELTRGRRSLATYSIDVAAVVDFSVYSKFLLAARGDKTAAMKKIREYYAFIFDWVSQRFLSLNTNYVIRVYLSQLYVVESESTSPLSGINHPNNKVQSSLVLDTFRQFIKDKATDMLTSFDHVILFTGYDLTYGLDETSQGIAYVETMCNTDGRSVSVTAETTNYKNIYDVVYNLAYSLSANDDGVGSNVDCLASERYIMGNFFSTKSDQNKYNPWQFSPCSVASFTSYLQQQLRTSRGATCLNDHSPRDNSIPDVSGRLLGQEVNADQQCKATFGPDSKICVGLQKSGSELCHVLFCQKPGTTLCYQQAALDGTTCGDRKICRSGYCVYDPRAPSADESCLFGDSSTLVHEGKNCQQLVNNFSGECYEATFIELCCTSCQIAQRNVKNCEYGDKLKGCTSDRCSEYPSDCCGTCKFGEFFNPTPKPTVPYVPRPSSENLDPTDIVCRNKEWRCYFLSDADIFQCYDSNFKSSCCQFCQKHQTQTPGCEYGDRRPDLCRQSNSCLVNPFLCCQFCRPTTTVPTRDPFTPVPTRYPINLLATTRRAFSGSPLIYNRNTLIQHILFFISLVMFLTY